MKKNIKPDMIIYQLRAIGDYKVFQQRGTIYSENVYINKPTQKHIDDFKDVCCNSEGGLSFYDLQPETIEINIVELIVNE